MVASQTVYLRSRNEELLSDLKENAKHLNKRIEICSDLLRGRSLYSPEEFTKQRNLSPEMSPVAKSNHQDRVQPVKVLNSNSSNRHRSWSAGQILSRSAVRDVSPRRGHRSCVPSQPLSHGSSIDSRWSKFQQDLASNTHMHGYTLSHSLSKCYCTRKDGGDTGTSLVSGSRILAESLTGKNTIPPRLKEKRHQARSPKKRSCNVKWALSNNKEAADLLPDDIYNIRLPIQDFENNHKPSTFLCGCPSPSIAHADAPMRTRCAPVDKPPSEHDSDWFRKMKNFRRSNWDDCHAPDYQEHVKADCKCNSLFRVGERLFLEPIQTSVTNHDCYCSKPQESVKITSPHRTVVTLPKVRSGDLEKHKEERMLSDESTGRTSGTFNLNGPCFLTGHLTKKNDNQLRSFVLQRPADSFALRYQKGVNPRRL